MPYEFVQKAGVCRQCVGCVCLCARWDASMLYGCWCGVVCARLRAECVAQNAVSAKFSPIIHLCTSLQTRSGPMCVLGKVVTKNKKTGLSDACTLAVARI